MSRGLDLDSLKFLITPRDADNKASMNVIGTKETLKQVLEAVEEKSKHMKEQFHHLESPELITIAVDFPFLSLTPILRRLGYQTYDQHDEECGEQFTREEVVQTLVKYMENKLSTAEIRHCYLLTDEKTAQQVSFDFR